jgi:hypothetical protein
MTISLIERHDIAIAIPNGVDSRLTAHLLAASKGERIMICYGPNHEVRECAPDRPSILPNGHVEVRFDGDSQPVIVYPDMVHSLKLTDPSPDVMNSIRAAAEDALVRAAALADFANDLLAATDEES